jgi:protein-L-isoaspartate(D-aspartate) O-methyltransferase
MEKISEEIQAMIAIIKKHDHYARLENKNAIITSESLAAMAQIDRKLFVPDNQKQHAYSDMPLQIGYQQTISQPYIVALMASILEVNSGSIVLEIGTGSGYQAAILSQIVKTIYSLEIVEDLSLNARKIFSELGINNIYCDCHNGYLGWEKYAPFDGIITTAASKQIPKTLIKQLKIGANIIIPLEDIYGDQTLYILKKKANSKIEQIPIIPVRFVPMIEP